MAPIEKFLAKEARMQNYRWATPIGLAANLFASIGGLAAVGFGISHYVDAQDKKDAMIFEQMKSLKDGEARDIICLTRSVYSCCGEKANVTC